MPIGSSAQRLLRLTHTGGNQALIVDALVLGADPSFRLIAAPQLPFVLAPGSSIDLTVEFTATSGISTSTLDVGSPGRSARRIALSGEGVAAGSGTVLYRINVGGPAVTALDPPAPSWSADGAATASPWRIEGGAELYDDSAGSAYPGPINMTHASLPANVPIQVFHSERWDPGTAPELRYAFPVENGTRLEVRLYFAELYSGTDTIGERVFDVRVEGAVPPPFASIDRFATAGAKGAMMRSALTTVTDGILDIEFLHLADNPALNAIEIRSAPSDALFEDGFEYAP